MNGNYTNIAIHLSSNTKIEQNGILEKDFCKILDGTEQSLPPTKNQTVQHLVFSNLGKSELKTL